MRNRGKKPHKPTTNLEKTMPKKMSANTNNQRNHLVQANAWIKRESREIIKKIAKQERRSYASQVAFIIDQFADCMKQPA